MTQDSPYGTAPVRVPAEGVTLAGDLGVPRGAAGVVLFAHGSGSGRHSPRNRYVAEALRNAGLATLLLDLLTADEERSEERTGHLRFDIRFLARRLVDTTLWLTRTPETAHLRVGYFGASTGGGAALVAAATLPESVGAVVSRGGRPDLAGDALPYVQAPTLLIVGGEDAPVIDMNARARAAMRAPTRMIVIPGASHLFEEPGALEQVASLAAEWFIRHLEHAPQHELRMGRDARG